MKKILVVGIDDYFGTVNDLSCCVRDANDWADKFLNYFDFDDATILCNSDATRKNITNTLKNMISEAQAEDDIVFCYSGHGTSVLDVSNDELDGYDEALYVYDGVLLDDTLREIIQELPLDVHLTVILDSCFSGSCTKKVTDPTARIRYYQTDVIPADLPKKKSFLQEEDMVEILLSGCGDGEYSYEGNGNGAFTAATLSVIKKGQTYSELYTLVRTLLPSARYPQTPQLEGSSENKNRVMFESTETGVSDEIFEDNEDYLVNSYYPDTWFEKYWWVILLGLCALYLLYRLIF